MYYNTIGCGRQIIEIWQDEFTMTWPEFSMGVYTRSSNSTEVSARGLCGLKFNMVFYHGILPVASGSKAISVPVFEHMKRSSPCSNEKVFVLLLFWSLYFPSTSCWSPFEMFSCVRHCWHSYGPNFFFFFANNLTTATFILLYWQKKASNCKMF